MTVSRQGRKGFALIRGFLNCLNVQIGQVDVTVAGAAGSTAVIFEKYMDDTPTIILKSTEALPDDELLYANTITNEGFTAGVLSASSDTYTLNWLAVSAKRFGRSVFRSGWKSGNFYCRNIQAGTVELPTDAAGAGTATTVKFDAPFKKIPVVLLTVQETIATGQVNISTKPTRQGFTVDVTGSDVTSAALTVGWVAIDAARLWDKRSNLSTNLPSTGDNKANRLGRPGLHAGHLTANNIQSGHNTLATDSSGDGTAEAVTYIKPMNQNATLALTPLVFAEPQEQDTTGNTVVTSQADTGFTLDVTDSSVLSGNLTVGWVALGMFPTLID